MKNGDKSFDIVLLFGPLYHLQSEEDQLTCIKEATRVCKENGKIFFAFISNDFVFHTVDACKKLLAQDNIKVIHRIAADGASELLEKRINEMSEEDYAQYLRYHFYICEKPELLGMTNHLLFVGEKTSEF